jgi:hypothetical protein
MKLPWLIALAALSFLATLVLHAPAALLYSQKEGKPPADAVRLHGIQGTLSRGGFSALTVNNRVVLTDARWTLHPLWLGLLRLSADLAVSGNGGGDAVLRASVSRAVFGKLRWSDVDAAASVKTLLSAANQAALPVEGQIRLNLPLVLMDAGVPVHAEGSAELQGLAWTLAREPLQLGDFSAALSTDDKGILATLSSGPGPLELSGEARLSGDRSYDLHMQLKPRPEASAQLQTLIRSLGKPDVQGWYHIRKQGTL